MTNIIDFLAIFAIGYFLGYLGGVYHSIKMKVLRHGNVKTYNDNTKHKCIYCNCVFTFSKEDVINNYTTSSQDIVKCPECNKSNGVSHYAVDKHPNKEI